MKSRYFLALALISILEGRPVPAQVVINEISYDEIGSDTNEYIELYNAGATAVDIGGWSLSGGTDVAERFVSFPAGTVLAPGGFYLIGSNTAGSTGISGIDIYLGGIIRNYQYYLTLRNASDQVVDSVVYARGENSANIQAGQGEPPHTGTLGSGGGIRAYNLISKNNNGTNQPFNLTGSPNASLTLQRSPNAAFLDTGDNERDFHLAIATPREPNFSRGTVTPVQVAAGLTFDFNEADSTVEPRLAGAFSSVFTQDPTVADAIPAGSAVSPVNPSVIPPAPFPGGGNVGITWSHADFASAGYGNAAILNLTEPIADVEAEALVYIGSALSGAQYEVGDYFLLRGRPDPFHFYGYDVVNPSKPNGDVGIRLRFENNVNGSGQVNLFVDERVDGAVTFTSAPVPVPAAGWYRLLLSVKGNSVAAILGGTYGSTSADGTLAGGIRLPDNSGGVYTATLSRPGGIGMNYHTKIPAGGESLSVVRPLTYDHLTFRAPTLIPASSINEWSLY